MATPTPPRYTQKTRAKRITLQYWKRMHPFRRWKRILSIALPLIGAVWVVAYAARDDQRLYNGGPVSTAHAMFESECRLCHGPGLPEGQPITQASLSAAVKAQPAKFFLYASDGACKTCHAGPVHHDNETFTPECASCHVEHLGRAVLAQIADRHCVQCHADLQTKDGKGGFHKTVPALDKHPEIAVNVREGGKLVRVRLDQKEQLKDTAQIKLNHAKHLKANLKGIDEIEKANPKAPGIAKVKDGKQLSCTFCHRPDERGQYLQPVTFTQHCAACHPLDYDGRFPDSVVPHPSTPQLVRTFLRGTLSEAFDQCQAIPAGDAGKAIRDKCVELELAKAAPTGDEPRGRRRGGAAEEAPPPDEPRGRRGARAEAPPAAEAAPADEPRGRRRGGAAAEETPAAPVSWVTAQLGSIEPTTFKQRCEFCHTVTKGDPLPKVEPTAMPARWMPHAKFDHAPHRSVGCVECHKATASQETKDVLLPSIATCQECHQPKGGARTGCVECHRYHDKGMERDPDGPYKVKQMLSGSGGSRGDRLK